MSASSWLFKKQRGCDDDTDCRLVGVAVILGITFIFCVLLVLCGRRRHRVAAAAAPDDQTTNNELSASTFICQKLIKQSDR
ncbi:hypothetical protein COCNU_03G013400 [Cocos nucifera]|uniref:Uncharacterized protein n=1 Tax=Cocos nucifera TaxID=13894 RepID=A0A8K0I477_COCNU|nr:hypothetical protein COCNU_03G013400 [Cocos nucifera]